MAAAMLQQQHGLHCPVALQFSRATDLVQWPSLKFVSFKCSCKSSALTHVQSSSRVAAAAECSSSSSRRRTTAARTAAAAQQQQSQTDYDADLQPQQLLAALSQTRSYSQLAAFVQSQAAAFLQSPLCVYALLHAVQLRDTLSDDQLGKGSLATEDKVLQQMEMVESLLESLCDAAEQHVAELPLPTQATLALALAQLDYYHGPLYTAIAAAVLQQLAEKQPADGDSSTPDTVGAASAAGVQLRSAALAGLPQGLVPGVLLSLAVAYSLNGHHDAALLDELAAQAVAFRGLFPDASPLISIAAALLDLQHYCPALLAAAADAALQQGTAAAAAAEAEDDNNQQQQQQGGGAGAAASSLAPEEVVSLLLALGFFRVPAPEFVESALEAFAEEPQVLLELPPLQLARLWKALLLLRDCGMNPPQQLMQAFQELQQEAPELLLLGTIRAAVAPNDLAAVAAAEPAIVQQWEAAGLLAPAQILAAVQGLGYELERKVEVAAAGGKQQQQQPQEGQDGVLSAVVDVCLRLPDQRRVAVLVLDDGRYCHSPPPPKRLRGAAAVDVLVLQALGLAVLPLPISEWQALGGYAQQQQRYLRARLAAATG